MFVCNREHYGFLPMPLKSHQSLQEEAENFVHTLIEAMSKFLCLPMVEPPLRGHVCRALLPAAQLSSPLGACSLLWLLSYWLDMQFSLFHPFPT